MYGPTCQGGGVTFGFVRVVRASSRRVGMSIFYYITLEAVDELGDLNVYYAEVENSHLKNIKRLVEWQLVNESFSYRFQEIRYACISTFRVKSILECFWL